MANENGVLREVAWLELCPWLLLVRTFRLAISAPVLALATLGVVVTPAGWWVSQLVFVPQQQLAEDPALARLAELNRRGVMGRAAPPALSSRGLVDRVRWQTHLRQRVADVLEPCRLLADVEPRFTGRLYLVAGGLWTLLVWSVLGGAITRIAVVQLARGRLLGLREALQYAAQHWLAYFFAPLTPLLFALALGLVVLVVFGLPLWFGLTALLAAILWPLALLLALGIALILIGLLFGWPLMWPAIGAEQRGDSFEAWSRSYSYVFQRPLNYLFYAAVALLIGWLGWLLVFTLAEAVGSYSLRAAAGAISQPRLGLLLASWPAAEPPADTTWLMRAAAGLVAFWVGLVRTVAVAYLVGFFWTAASGIYLLLRYDVDQAELDDVPLEDEQPGYGLPPLSQEAPGEPAGEAPSDTRPEAHEPRPDEPRPDEPPSGGPGAGG